MKRSYAITFSLRHDIILEIWSSFKKPDLFWFDNVRASIQYKNQRFYVYKNNIYEWVFAGWQNVIRYVLNNDNIHESITHSLGLMRELQFENHAPHNLTFYIDNAIKRWIGNNYSVCGYNGRNVWIYKKNDHFYIEMAPYYLSDKGKKPSFKKFVETYKPYFIEEISRERLVALQAWIVEMEAIMDANRPRYQHLVKPKDGGFFVSVDQDQMPKD